MIRKREKKRAAQARTFTLIEVTVVLAVFSLVIIAASRSFMSVQDAWRKQQHTASLLDNGRWFLARLGSDICHSRKSTVTVDNNRRIGLHIDIGGTYSYEPGDDTIWYWRGDETPGEDHVVYCDLRENAADRVASHEAARQVAYTDEEDNAYEMFSQNSGLVKVRVVLRQFPDQSDDARNRGYELVTKFRARNH